MLQSLPISQQRQDEALYRRSIRDAILRIIDSYEKKPQGRTFFASIPELVEGYLVSIVLSVRTDVLDSYHRLKIGRVNIQTFRSNAPMNLYSWLFAHRFYLLKEDCDQVNRVIPKIEKNLDKPGRTVWVIRHIFKPDPRMDPSFYYLAEE
jgi:hypothetical protein